MRARVFVRRANAATSAAELAFFDGDTDPCSWAYSTLSEARCEVVSDEHRARLCSSEARLRFIEGQADAAIQLAETCHSLHEGSGNLHSEALALATLVTGYADRGLKNDATEALARFDERHRASLERGDAGALKSRLDPTIICEIGRGRLASDPADAASIWQSALDRADSSGKCV